MMITRESECNYLFKFTSHEYEENFANHTKLFFMDVDETKNLNIILPLILDLLSGVGLINASTEDVFDIHTSVETPKKSVSHS